MINRTDCEFNNLCGQATSVAFAYGYDNLATRLALCSDPQRFRWLCEDFEEWGGDNPIGEAFISQLQEICFTEKISEMLLDNDEMT